jgi:hypothetical protein
MSIVVADEEEEGRVEEEEGAGEMEGGSEYDEDCEGTGGGGRKELEDSEVLVRASRGLRDDELAKK